MKTGLRGLACFLLLSFCSHVNSQELPPLPAGVTSFGAAVVGDDVYLVGGNLGDAHGYSAEEQNTIFRRLNVKQGKWEELGAVPGRQGLGFVAHQGRLYRIGGFEAKNRKGDEPHLESTADFTVFDPDTMQWEDLPAMPEARSSFDAVSAGDWIYVVGGWELRPHVETTWHQTAYRINPQQKPLQWEAIPDAPFQRRALSLGHQDGKIYVIGGMEKGGGPTTRVDVYDAETQTWSAGPELPGVNMDGFGSAAINVDGRLYVSTFSGQLLGLSADGQKWETIGKLKTDRFFHRMLPMPGGGLLILGGTSRAAGKIVDLEVFALQ